MALLIILRAFNYFFVLLAGSSRTSYCCLRTLVLRAQQRSAPAKRKHPLPCSVSAQNPNSVRATARAPSKITK